MAVHASSHVGRRSWPQRLLITCNAVLVMVLAAGATVVGTGYTQFKSIRKLAISSGVLDEPEDPGDPQNLLLVGTDSRAGITRGDRDAGSFLNGKVDAGERADAIMILRLDPRTKQASLVSLPRDLWVPIAGTKHKQRINTALEGGPERLINTIRLNFNISISHYFQVDFNGFRSLVDAIDGVRIYFDTPARDKHTGLDIDEPGCHVLDGSQALAYARSRYYEYKNDRGRWVFDGSSDIGRNQRQQTFIRQVLKQAAAKTGRNPTKALPVMRSGVQLLEIDDAFTLDDALHLAKVFRSFNPDEIASFSLPTTPAKIGGADVLLLQPRKAEPTLEVFRGTRAPGDLAASDVDVRVVNGSGVSNQAAAVKEALEYMGFGATITQGRTAQVMQRSVIQFAPGKQKAAELVWSHLVEDARLEESPNLGGVDVVLTTGTGFTNLIEAPRTGTPTVATLPPTSSTSVGRITTSTTVPTEQTPASCG